MSVGNHYEHWGRAVKAAVIAVLLAGLLPACVLAGKGAEPEAVTICGVTYAVVPDEQMRTWGFPLPRIPRERNAAWIYFKAMNAYSEPERGSELRALRDAVLEGKWTAESAPLEKYIEGNAKAFALVKKAAAMAECYFPPLGNQGDTFEDVSVSGLSIPYLTQMRELARFLVVCGKKLETAGDPAKALDAYLLAPRVGYHTSRGPMLIHGLLGLAVNRMALGAIEQCVLRHDLDEHLLAEVQAHVHKLSRRRPDIRWAMANEKVCSVQVVDHVLEHPEVYGGLWEGRLALWLAGLKESEWHAIARADVREYWEILEKGLCMALPEYLNSNVSQELTRRVRARRFPPNLMAIVGPALPRMTYAWNELWWTVLDVEFALARYRAEHGRYPEKIEDAKDLMLSDGIDPFSGERLKYRLEKDGSFTLWSVGENVKDDGGKVEKAASRWMEDDIVWNSRLLRGEK